MSKVQRDLFNKLNRLEPNKLEEEIKTTFSEASESSLILHGYTREYYWGEYTLTLYFVCPASSSKPRFTISLSTSSNGRVLHFDGLVDDCSQTLLRFCFMANSLIDAFESIENSMWAIGGERTKGLFNLEYGNVAVPESSFDFNFEVVVHPIAPHDKFIKFSVVLLDNDADKKSVVPMKQLLPKILDGINNVEHKEVSGFPVKLSGIMFVSREEF